MDGFYGSYDSTSDHQYHSYADKTLIPPSENLLTPLTVYHHDPHEQYNSYNYPLTENHNQVDGIVGPVLGSSDQGLRFQSCSGVAASEPPNLFDVSYNRREGVLHDHDQSHGDHKPVSSLMKAKIASHPSYPKLLSAYIDCQKVGAPLEIATLLDQIKREADHLRDQESVSTTSLVGDDPELDEFMETFCEVLVKCKSDLSRPFDEATSFLNRVESQLGSLICNDDINALSSSDEEATRSTVRSGISIQDLQMKNEDHREIKDMLLRKYGGNHIGRLKMEFSKNKKKVKLPKEARQALLDWWNLHYKWPYPTEADKISLAESTGLDQKQINNWFINQRKRHWKSSENMHSAMMDNYSTHFSND